MSCRICARPWRNPTKMYACCKANTAAEAPALVSGSYEASLVSGGEPEPSLVSGAEIGSTKDELKAAKALLEVPDADAE